MRSPIDPPTRPMLFDTLSVLLPIREQTWLLRACLHEGERGSSAWDDWQERVGNPKKALVKERQRISWMLPLLYHALQRHGAGVDRDLLPYLRTAYFREELRTQAFRRTCQDVLSSLATADIPLIVLNETVLADAVYSDWALRHCYTLDILVTEEDLPLAVRVLGASGLSLPDGRLDTGARAIRFEHQSGVPTILHRDLFPLPYYQAPLADVRDRTVPRQILNVPVRILSPADLLLQAVGQASCSRSRDTLQWVCDAWFILKEYEKLDWDVLVESTLRSRLALPLSVMLAYLVDELDAPIPGSVLDRLVDAGAKATTVAREAALTGARAGVHGTFKNLIRQSSSWLERAVVLKWMVLPSLSYLRWAYPGCPSSLLPLYYGYRPLRTIAQHIFLALRQSTRRQPLQGTPSGNRS